MRDDTHSLDGILLRIMELIKEDPDLHDAIVHLIEARAEALFELAEWRRRRKAADVKALIDLEKWKRENPEGSPE